MKVNIEDEYVAWLRAKRHGDRSWFTVCGSHDEGAFKVYRHPISDEELARLRILQVDQKAWAEKAKEMFKVQAELRAAHAEIERLRGGWQPIETAPRDGTRILVWTINEEIELSDYFKLSYFEYQEVGNGLYKKIESVGPEGWNSNPFTKWQPLPLPPGREVST